VIYSTRRYIDRNSAGIAGLFGGRAECGFDELLQVGLAFIYLYVTVFIPTTHHCMVGAVCSEHYHSIDSNHCCNEEGHCGAEGGASLEEDGFDSEGQFAHGMCLACLYSATAKTYASGFGGSFVIYEGESKAEIPKDGVLVKSFGWLCSHPLRGPPGITS
jgi:hypothetical protein